MSKPYWPHSNPEAPSTTHGSGLCICEHSEPRLALSGLVICGWHHANVRDAIAELPAIHSGLEKHLTSTGSGAQERVNSTPQPGLSLNPRVTQARADILTHLHCWARIGSEEGPWATAPKDTPQAITTWIVDRLDWYCAREWSEEFVRETLELHRESERLLTPNDTRRFTVGRCPEPECGGTLITLLRPEDSLLPSVVWCDTAEVDPETGEQQHIWPAGEWRQLGRKVTGMDIA